ncbi:MAG: ribosomal-processing cysteine protease Prp [Firmicutes bacterium]|uniref:Ribosomal processing cysteine protease Prp n=1 Tax=Candidatus Onthovivens merdipullorum TaxID=2840889 RepID=A0A9D9GX41_9BACL|nr:ribosomal-processing cysteine protease Prp [Candidatus Onthovivens merdipullorum]
MIKAKFTKNVNDSIELLIEGHALFGEYGKDVICGAVSSIVIGGLNALNDISNFDVVIKEGFVKVQSKNKISEEDKIVINTILIQLETIEEKFPNYIKVIREE